MASAQNRERETLEEFTARSNLDNHFEQAVHPELDRKELPTIEHPDSISERKAAQEQENAPPEHDIKTDVKPSPDFFNAANNMSYDKNGGEGSEQVKRDAPENNLPAPENSEEIDRGAHNERMAKDDQKAKIAQEKEERLEQLWAALEEREIDRAYSHDRDKDHGQDYDYDR